MLVVPIVLYPLLFALIGTVSKNAASQPTVLMIAGAANAKALVATLRTDSELTVRLGRQPLAAVRDKRVDVGLWIPPNFEHFLRIGKQPTVELFVNSTRGSSSSGYNVLQAALKDYSLKVVVARLQAHGLKPSLLSPLRTHSTDIATKDERGGFLLSFILPIFIVLYAIAGGMYTAMDVSAGEKERSTLEALLLTPCTRLQITLGKLLAVSMVAFVTIVAALSSMIFSISRLADSSQGVSLDPTIVPLIFALGILMALAFSALELALGILARSFKEAQSYITPLYLASFLPVAIVNSIPGFQPPSFIFVIPAINAVLLFKEALLGQTNAQHAAITLVSLLVFALLAVSATVFMFTREKVLLKT